MGCPHFLIFGGKQMKTKLKLRHQPNYETPTCPYFDKDLKRCTRVGCYRMMGYECSYKNEKSRKRAIITKKWNNRRMNKR